METHRCLAVPKGEKDEMEIFTATQFLDGTQKMAAKALGVAENRITARIKRIGEKMLVLMSKFADFENVF